MVLGWRQPLLPYTWLRLGRGETLVFSFSSQNIKLNYLEKLKNCIEESFEDLLGLYEFSSLINVVLIFLKFKIY